MLQVMWLALTNQGALFQHSITILSLNLFYDIGPADKC